MNDRALESVILAVRENGLPCVTHGEYCEVDGGNLWIRPDVYIKGEGEGGARLVLEIKAVSHQIGDSPILEAFAASGATIEAAINQAFGKFLLGSFDVLIEALKKHHWTRSVTGRSIKYSKAPRVAISEYSGL